jgi:hypothetical protein
MAGFGVRSEVSYVVSRVERRLVNTSNFLNQGGKRHLVNSVLSSMATFYMCSIKVPIEILNKIDMCRRHCLWRKVTRPKMKGGLGVIKLRVQNEVLLLKNLHNFFNKVDLPWVHLI